MPKVETKEPPPSIGDNNPILDEIEAIELEITLRKPERDPMIAEIKAAVCKHFNVPPMVMRTERKATAVVRPRQIAMYLSVVMTTKSYPVIARAFGNRDHSTAMHAIKRVAALICTDKQVAADVEAIRQKILGARGEAEE